MILSVWPQCAIECEPASSRPLGDVVRPEGWMRLWKAWNIDKVKMLSRSGAFNDRTVEFFSGQRT